MDTLTAQFIAEGIDRIATEEFVDACVLRVTVATTGLRGGDSGHGGRTRIVFEDIAGTDIDCVVSDVSRRIEIRLSGDAELRTMVDALVFAATALQELMAKQST